MLLLVTMAVPKKAIDQTTDGYEGHVFERARIEVLDWEKRACTREIDYRPPPEHLGEGCSVRFTGGCSYQGQWFQCSGTEIVVYDTRDWSVQQVISHPSFHDLHGVTVVNDEIAIANTGLDMVQFLDLSGRIVREVNLASVPTWERFDRATDYRCVVSTKPHEIHPNHLFQIDGQWWVTRFLKCDAVNLANPEERIDIGVGQPHDGIIRGDFIYFTTTNAHLVIADVATRKVVEIIDLNRFNPWGGKIGWCRGLEVDGDFAYIGFSRLRKSKWAGTFQVAKDALRRRKRKSHIERIDLRQKKLVDSYDYETHGSSAIFSLMHYDRVTGKIAPEAASA
jgi:hypothetical protein